MAKGSTLQMLFRGGDIKRPRGDVMTRTGSGRQPLFRGGPARPDGDDDLRMSSRYMASPLFRGGDVKRPRGDELTDTGDPEQPLADGGEVGPDVSDELIVAAMDIQDAMGGGGFYDKPRDEDSKVERASKEAARKARAKVLAQALKAFFLICESEPHSEAGQD